MEKKAYLFLGLLFLSTLFHRLCKDHPLINTLQKKYSMGKMQIRIVKIFHAKRNILTCKKIAEAAVLNNLWFVIQVNTSFLAFCSMNSVLSPVAILSLKKPVITILWSYFINELPHFFALGDSFKGTSIFSHLCPQMQNMRVGFFLSKHHYGMYSPPRFAAILKLITWEEIFLHCYYNSIKDARMLISVRLISYVSHC